MGVPPRDCVLAVPSGSWQLITTPGCLEDLTFFIDTRCCAPWISQVQSTGLLPILFSWSTTVIMVDFYIITWKACSSIFSNPKKMSSAGLFKSSRLPAKITAYLVNIGRPLCLTFLYRWCFSNNISLDWPLTLTTQPSTSKLSDNPASVQGVLSNLRFWYKLLLISNC